MIPDPIELVETSRRVEGPSTDDASRIAAMARHIARQDHREGFRGAGPGGASVAAALALELLAGIPATEAALSLAATTYTEHLRALWTGAST